MNSIVKHLVKEISKASQTLQNLNKGVGEGKRGEERESERVFSSFSFYCF
jgi:hypothetical protein